MEGGRATGSEWAAPPGGRRLATARERAAYAAGLVLLFFVSGYTSVALLARVSPALFPARSLNNVPIVEAIDKVVPVPEASASGAFRDPIRVLILGVDKRAGEPFRDDEDGAYLTDVIMVASVDPVAKKTTILSFPRDLAIEVHRENGRTFETRINESYQIGVLEGGNRAAGVEQVRRDLKANFGVEVDDYVILDFEGVAGLVDALGGITVDIPPELAVEGPWAYSNDDETVRYVSFPAGRMQLDGYHAVAFGRHRGQDSDLERVKRQQLIVRAAVEKSFSSGILLRKPFELWDAFNRLIKTDISRARAPGLADLVKATNGEVETYSIADPVGERPTVFDGVIGDKAVLYWDAENVRYWLSRAFPETRHADAGVEIVDASGDAALAESLGHWLVYAKGMASVYQGPEAPPQKETLVVVLREAGRGAADDIAAWLELPPSRIVSRPAPSSDALSPDLIVVVGSDFQIPGTH